MVYGEHIMAQDLRFPNSQHTGIGINSAGLGGSAELVERDRQFFRIRKSPGHCRIWPRLSRAMLCPLGRAYSGRMLSGRQLERPTT